MANTTTSPFIRVHFYEPKADGKTDFYFGSLKAIFEVFTRDEIGCTLGSLYSMGFDENGRKTTKTCVIERSHLTRVTRSGGRASKS